MSANENRELDNRMNTTKQSLANWIGGIVAVGVVLLLISVLLNRQSGRQLAKTITPAPVTADTSVTQSGTQAPTPPVSQPTAVVEQVASLAAGSSPPFAGSPAEVVRVSPDKVLATVNGVAITLQDLIPLTVAKATTEQTLSAERFGFLLDRAIEREVAVQAARGQGLELSTSQRQQLGRLRARSDQTEPGVFDTVQEEPLNTEFAVRDAAGLLLQATLAEKAGVPSPHVTPAQVQAYYQQHQAEYGALPADSAQRAAAWERIDRDIRLKLASQVQAEHQARFDQFREQLKATAQITAPGT